MPLTRKRWPTGVLEPRRVFAARQFCGSRCRGLALRTVRIGERFGRLTVSEFVGVAASGHMLYRCICDCGGAKTAPAGNLRHGKTGSCGCIRAWRTFTCRACGKEFSRRSSGVGPYCSLQCTGLGKRGSQHPLWKGDAAEPRSARHRAVTLYPDLQPCAVCGIAKTERHHVDANTRNNVPENILFLCRRHHRQLHPGQGRTPLRPPSFLLGVTS